MGDLILCALVSKLQWTVFIARYTSGQLTYMYENHIEKFFVVRSMYVCHQRLNAHSYQIYSKYWRCHCHIVCVLPFVPDSILQISKKLFVCVFHFPPTAQTNETKCQQFHFGLKIKYNNVRIQERRHRNVAKVSEKRWWIGTDWKKMGGVESWRKLK